MSQHPARFIGDNLIWTYGGDVWAVWALVAPPYRRSPHADKLELHGRLSAAAMVMPGDWQVLGVSVPFTPDDVGASMEAHVDLDANPGWRHRVGTMKQNAKRARLERRVHYIAAALRAPAGQENWRLSAMAAYARLGRRFGLTPLPVRTVEFMQYQRAADELQATLRRSLGPERIRPASTGELLWLYARAAQRGVDEPVRADFGTPRSPALNLDTNRSLGCPALIDLDDARYLEGGSDQDVDRPRHRHYLRVESERGANYQTVLALSDMPEQWTYPGGDLLAHVDTLDFPVDWSIRVTSTTNADTQAAVKKQLRELTGQYDELQGDPAGTGPALDRAVDTLKHEWAELADNPNAPGLKVTFLFAIGAATLPELEKRAALIRTAYGASEYQMHRPTGDQDALHGAMQLAGPCPPAVEHYRQFILPKDLAGCAWAAGNVLGDATGSLIGLNMDTPRGTPVFLALENGPRTGHAGSAALVGKLGAGKSHEVKSILYDIVERGGVGIVTDRTGGAGGAEGEYVRLRHIFSANKRTQVVPVGIPDSDTCLDPLAVFEGEDAIRYATGFLTMLTRTGDPTDPQGAVLDDAVRHVAAAGGRLADVGAELDRMGQSDEDARQVAKKLRPFTRPGAMADVAFGRGTPVRLDADYIVFHAPHLTLPEPEQLADPSTLLREQVVGQGVVYLIAAVARSVILADDRRFGAYVQDEGYVMTSVSQGRVLLREIARDGRKRNAGLIFASHHPDDIGDSRLAELFTTRFVFRMDATAVAAGLEFLGLEDTPANRALLSESERRAGECMVRFLNGSVGLVKTLEAPTAAARVAFDTTPGAPPPPPPPTARVPRRLRGAQGQVPVAS